MMALLTSPFDYASTGWIGWMHSMVIAILCSGFLVRADLDFDPYISSQLTDDRQQMCYSCMSTDKEQTWQYLSHVYIKPLNFTDHCDRPMISYKMGLVPCSSVCVVITEMRLVSGQFAGYSFTRGCINSIAKNGFRNATLREYHFELRPSCERLPRNTIFFKSNPAIEDQIYFCTCFGDRCNDDRLNSAAPSPRLMVTYSYHASARFVLVPWAYVQLVLRSLVFPLGVFIVWSCLLLHDIRLRCS